MGSGLGLYDDASNPVDFTGEDAKKLVNGVSAKAWVNFNGSGTVAIRDSFNVSSITDIAIGKFEANFTVPMSNINYCLLGTCGRGVDMGTARSVQLSDIPTTSKCQFQTIYASVDTDDEYNFIAILSN